MEKQAKYQDKILKFLPRAASVVTFQNPPFSPNRDNRMRSENGSKQLKLAHVGRGFSGPIISMIPDEARRKPKNGNYEAQEDQEPTSPKISCMGQIKHKKKKKNMVKKNVVNKRVSMPVQESKPAMWSPREVKKQTSAIKRIFSASITKVPGRKSNASSVDNNHDDHHHHDKPTLPDRAPSLSQMKRFASGRDCFTNFDWAAAQVTPVDADLQNIYYSDHGGSDQEEEEEEVMIPFSAPIIVGGGVPLQPRKEINIWKRRTMNPPRPLDLHTTMIRAN